MKIGIIGGGVSGLAARDTCFCYILVSENRNVVEAYFNGFRAVLKDEPEFFIEMDGGGSVAGSSFRRRCLSKFGFFVVCMLLDGPMQDAMNGYEAFHCEMMEKILAYLQRSKAHFYRTELRNLCRYRNRIELPLHYTAPSMSVSPKALKNARNCLPYYMFKHWFCRGEKIA